ncbi:hypothetical protein PYCCODRAFT_1059794 [Trametes coccinea BRFM310]|uniref:Uncharacterized protein n=1 Tax=Trametes coccinea (strain BRFM310) TaxID=1353009 RepID=A0A1Y2IXS6_TRAC3|nr:hypothetical protein PYCCODRAFT_1059794 [Trametes coccinea BRFM310]
MLRRVERWKRGGGRGHVRTKKRQPCAARRRTNPMRQAACAASGRRIIACEALSIIAACASAKVAQCCRVAGARLSRLRGRGFGEGASPRVWRPDCRWPRSRVGLDHEKQRGTAAGRMLPGASSDIREIRFEQEFSRRRTVNLSVREYNTTVYGRPGSQAG